MNSSESEDTDHTIALPVLPKDLTYRKHLLTAPPHTDQPCFVFSFVDADRAIIFCCRPGVDKTWTRRSWLIQKQQFPIHDAIKCDGKLYVIYDTDELGEIKFTDSGEVSFRGCDGFTLPPRRSPFYKYRLVESHSEVFAVGRKSIFDIDVFKMNSSQNRWDRVSKLNPDTCFGFYGTLSASFSASELGVKENSIFFEENEFPDIDSSLFSFNLLDMSLTSVYDWIKFRAVCKELKSLAHPIQWTPKLAIPFEYPWLMYPHEEIQGMYNFYDPVSNLMMHSICIPELENCKIRFSHQGWLLVTKPPTSVFFFEPFTRTTFPLQDLTHGLYDAFCFSEAPTSMDWQIFGISHSTPESFKICHLRSGLPWLLGTFQFFPAIAHPFFSNLVFDGQYFCYLEKHGNVLCFDGNNVHHPIVKGSFSRVLMSNYWRQFLVCSGDEMLSVWIHKLRDSMHVSKLNSQGDKWVKIKSVDKKSLYLSQTASLAVETKSPRMRDTVQLCMFSEIHGHDKNKNISFSLKDQNFYIYNGTQGYSALEDIYHTKEIFLRGTWIQPLIQPHAIIW
ncbi:F-box protein [Corchorus olitorius]|uniref:F-box protein n=1 Tax=Corchorus olitorius TaxID=93759 RepID=A0A1R3HEB7_9ROSI|nr:F-box protein [Corchorus olitorius]